MLLITRFAIPPVLYLLRDPDSYPNPEESARHSHSAAQADHQLYTDMYCLRGIYTLRIDCGLYTSLSDKTTSSIEYSQLYRNGILPPRRL